MQVNELIEKAQILVDSTGKKKAILLDYAFWEELLEDLEDMEALDRSRKANGEYVSWGTSQSETASGRDRCIGFASAVWPCETSPDYHRNTPA